LTELRVGYQSACNPNTITESFWILKGFRMGAMKQDATHALKNDLLVS
jgi:hypothetical protein